MSNMFAPPPPIFPLVGGGGGATAPLPRIDASGKFESSNIYFASSMLAYQI